MGAFMQMLRASRPVPQITQVQPMVASVPVAEYKARNVLPWDRNGVAIHATRAILSAPIWGSTKPGDFITIQGAAPVTPIVVHVPTIAGSNLPQGGVIQ